MQPIPKPKSVETLPQGKLWRGVPTPDARHALGSILGRQDVDHLKPASRRLPGDDLEKRQPADDFRMPTKRLEEAVMVGQPLDPLSQLSDLGSQA